MISKKTAYLGILIAAAFIFSYIEFLIPINFGIPGIKLGLANLVVIIALYTLGEGMAFSLSIIRIILVGFTFGNLSAMLYSFAGGIVSFLVMVLAKKSGLFSEAECSDEASVPHPLRARWLHLDTASLWIRDVHSGKSHREGRFRCCGFDIQFREFRCRTGETSVMLGIWDTATSI
jgi:heptaprenyl diphosphate synthase